MVQLCMPSHESDVKVSLIIKKPEKCPAFMRSTQNMGICMQMALL